MYVKRESYDPDQGHGLLKVGKAETLSLTKDSAVEHLRQVADPETVEKFGDESQADDEFFSFVLSTPAPDRSKDRVMQANWDLADYKANPVVLWGHDYSLPPVGRSAAIFRGLDGNLRSLNVFQTETAEGYACKALYSKGFLKAVSVGFVSTEWEPNELGGIDFLANSLLEHSAVTVPAHPGALIEARSAGIDLEPVREHYRKMLGDLEAYGRLLTQPEPDPALDPEVVKLIAATLKAQLQQPWHDALAQLKTALTGRI